MPGDEHAPVERASGNDLAELVCDTTGTSMQVAAVLVLDTRSPADIAAVRDALAERITTVPRLRQRLVDTPFGCGGPVWVDDPAFHVDNHVTSARCPVPGGERALLGVVAEAVTRRLPRDGPLWSATLVTDVSPDRCALVLVFHHVLADGIGGLAVLARLVDGVPPVPHLGFPRRAPRVRELASDAFRRQARTTELGNQVGVVPVEIPTTGDPVRRLAAIARITRQRRTTAPGSSAALLGWTFRALAKIGAYRWFVDRQRLVNTFVSDLRGPDHVMSFLGAPVVDLIPVSGISGNVTVAFVALSYAGTLTVTVIADPDRVPDLEELAGALHRELHEQGGGTHPVTAFGLR